MGHASIRRHFGRAFIAVGLVAVAAVWAPLTGERSASAVTSGIVTGDLALNLDPNLTSSYPGSGTTVTDLSGAGRNGTIQGSPLPTFSNVGPKSFEFTRTWVSNTASTAGKIAVAGTFLTDNFTLQAWIKTDQVGYSTAHYTTMYIMASECGGGANDWGLGVNNTGKLAFGAGTSDATFATSDAVNTNAWTNVAATRDKASGAIRLYINGVLKGSGTGNSGNSLTCSADGKTWIGNGQDAPAWSFGGKISSVLAYTRVLSADDVLANYNATVDTFNPVTYTITYDANGATSGTPPANSTYTTGGSATTVASNSGVLARTNHTFAGWNTASDGSGTTYLAGVDAYSSRANVTLYAMWTPIPTTTTTTSSTTVPPAAVIDIQVPSSSSSPPQTVSVASTVPASAASTIPLTPTSSTTSTVAPTRNLAPPPVIPKVQPGESALDIDGVTTKVELSRENNQLVVKSGPLSAALSGLDGNGETRALDDDGNLRLAGGDVVKLNMGGFKPDSVVNVWLFSTPQRLGEAKVDSAGKMSASFTIPEDVETGPHRVAITALLPNGKSATFTLGIVVGGPTETSTLAQVLLAIPIAIAVGIGFIVPNQLRRRRKQSAV